MGRVDQEGFFVGKKRIRPGAELLRAFIRHVARLTLVALPLADIRGTLTFLRDLQLASRTTCLTSSLGTLDSLATLRRDLVGAALIPFLSPPTTLGVKVVFFLFLGDT